MAVYDDLTLDSALADPMIDLVRRADGIDRHSFATLLHTAASAVRDGRRARFDVLESTQSAGAIAMAVRKKCCGSAHAL